MIPHFELVREFSKTYSVQMPRAFVDANNDVARLRYALIKEEHEEYLAAEPMSVNLLDAIVDLLYVTHGALLSLGLKYNPFISESLPHTQQKHSIKHVVDLVLPELTAKQLCETRIHTTLHLLNRALYDVADSHYFDIDTAFRKVHGRNLDKRWTREELDEFPGYKETSNYELYLNLPRNARVIVVHNEAGKIIKPASWQPADLRPEVTAAMHRFQSQSAEPPTASPESAQPAPDQPKADPSRRPGSGFWKATDKK